MSHCEYFVFPFQREAGSVLNMRQCFHSVTYVCVYVSAKVVHVDLGEEELLVPWGNPVRLSTH
jgi:hypothetical protein